MTPACSRSTPRNSNRRDSMARRTPQIVMEPLLRQAASESPIVFQCPLCGFAVTHPLRMLVSCLPADLEAGKPAVPAGHFAICDDARWTKREGRILVNAESLIHTEFHPDSGRHNGCCGRDGLDGPNRVCANGHEIATEVSDCWTLHAVVLIKAVAWKQVG